MRSVNPREPDLTNQFRAVAARYVSGGEELESVATDFARLWKRWVEGLTAGPAANAQREAPVAHLTVWSEGALWPDPSDREAERLAELIAAAAAKLHQ